MLERCILALCNNVTDPENNTSLHQIPFFSETCPIKKRRQNRWVNFVLERRKNWVLGITSSLCSEDDFTRPHNLGAVKIKRELKRDQSGVCVVPLRHISRDNCEEEIPRREKQRTVNRKSRCLSLATRARSVYILLFCPLLRVPYFPPSSSSNINFTVLEERKNRIHINIYKLHIENNKEY